VRSFASAEVRCEKENNFLWHLILISSGRYRGLYDPNFSQGLNYFREAKSQSLRPISEFCAALRVNEKHIDTGDNEGKGGKQDAGEQVGGSSKEKMPAN